MTRKPTIDMTLTGDLRIGYPSTNYRDDYVEIAIEDRASGVQFLTIELSYEELARAVAGRGADRLTMRLRGINRVGCEAETKSQFVPGEWAYRSRDEDARKALAPFEVDGWTGYANDFGNHHKTKEVDGVKGYIVTFRRHVRPDGTPVE